MTTLKVGDRVKVEGFLNWITPHGWSVQSIPMKGYVCTIRGPLVRVTLDEGSLVVQVYFKQCRKLIPKGSN